MSIVFSSKGVCRSAEELIRTRHQKTESSIGVCVDGHHLSLAQSHLCNLPQHNDRLHVFSCTLYRVGNRNWRLSCAGTLSSRSPVNCSCSCKPRSRCVFPPAQNVCTAHVLSETTDCFFTAPRNILHCSPFFIPELLKCASADPASRDFTW